MAISSVKVVLLSTGVLSMAILLKLSVPMVLYFYLHQAPLIWTSVVSWLRPPYLYVVINCIIITIAASSRFHKHEDQEQGHHLRDEPQVVEIPRKVTLAEMRDVAVVEADAVCVEAILDDPEEGKLLGGGFCKDKSEEVLINGDGGDEVDDIGGEDEYVISRSTWVPPPKRIDSSEKELLEDVVSLSPASSEKPLVSSRFGHRKPGRPSPEGGRGALRVSKPKRQETLENTWKTITEGRPMPLARHLKKSETFGDHGRQVNVSPVAAVKKSETLRDRTNYQLPPVVRPSPSPPSGKLRKEPSLSQDELNRRVEAFIQKFNEEMRLQRQESLNQYKEMMMASRAD